MNDSFLLVCKQNYFDGITPSNKLNYDKVGYKKAVAISEKYFSKNLYDQFANYLMEGQYLISLWAAHMLIEYGAPTKEVLDFAIKVIKRHSDNPLAPEVAEEECKWLEDNLKNYSHDTI